MWMLIGVGSEWSIMHLCIFCYGLVESQFLRCWLWIRDFSREEESEITEAFGSETAFLIKKMFRDC